MIKKNKYKMFQVFLVSILFLYLSTLAAASAPAEQWNRSFGGDGKDISRCVQQTSDGGYIVAGTTIPTVQVIKNGLKYFQIALYILSGRLLTMDM